MPTDRSLDIVAEQRDVMHTPRRRRHMQGTDMAQTLMADVSEDVAATAWDAVRAALAPHAGPEGSS